jgi:hypothetical protein
MDKMLVLHRSLEGSGMLQGFCSGVSSKLDDATNDAANVPVDSPLAEELEDEDESPVSGRSQDVSEFDVQPATKSRACTVFF